MTYFSEFWACNYGMMFEFLQIEDTGNSADYHTSSLIYDGLDIIQDTTD